MISSRNRLGIVVILLISIFDKVFSGASAFQQNEICQSYNGRRLYLDSNEHGILQTSNPITTNFKNKVAKVERLSNGTANIHYQCQMELITCSACAFKINILDANFTKTCNDDDESCQCLDYLSFSEPPYDDNTPEQKWCGQAPFEFHSKSRVLVISYVYQFGHNNSFELDYSSEKNVIVYRGYASQNETIQNDTISSPFFPTYYPRDLIIEYLIECISPDITDCKIEITFSDFQLSSSSVMELYNGNDENAVQRYTGDVFRPPIIYSTATSMTIRFYANGGTGLGYKANIRYLTQADINHTVNTHCGGLVESFGGAITMMNMTDSSDVTNVFDCIWLIKPPNSYLHLKTHLLVRIDTFKEMADTSLIVIREGLTSESTLLQEYEWPLEKAVETSFRTFVTTLSTGFYISFRGVFNLESRFAIVYTTFSYMDCFPGPEFLCENHRCIPFFLQCDGFDHCGDSSDESEHCSPDEQKHTEANEFWLTHTPNYFFPKTDHYPDMKTAALVFLASAMSLIMLILLLIVILYRMNHHVREQRELQSQLRTISELLDNNVNNQLDDNEAAHEQPPAYEHPPDYEEASSIKIDMNSRRSSRQMSSKRARSRSRSRCSIHCEPNSLLDTPSTSDTPIPSDVIIPDLFLTDQQGLLSTDFIECAVASLRSSRRRQSESVAVHSRRNSQILLIPESPPPEYTPRRARIKNLMQSTMSPSTLTQQNSNVNPNVIIQGHQPMVDIQEKMNYTTFNDQLPLRFIHRRHSFQDPRQHHHRHNFEQAGNGLGEPKNDFAQMRSLNLIKNLGAIRQKYTKFETVQRRRKVKTLRKTSSENELLLMSQSNENNINNSSTVRRSLSSGLLF